MKYYTDQHKKKIDYEILAKEYVKSGWGTDVYKLNNDVYKLYKPICLKYRLTEDDIKYLSNIWTNRILLPKKVIYDENNNFRGYTMKYIKPENKSEIKDLRMNKIIKELKLIKEDLITLKDNNVFVDDLCDDNFVFNKGLYIIDSGSFEINKKRSKDYIEIMNREIMHDFIIKYVLFRHCKLNINQIKEINKIFPLDEYISDVMEDTITKNELIYKYTNRIINNL